MKYLAVATDYDGTLAEPTGIVANETLAALRRCRDSGRRLLLVTGREMNDLLSVFSQVDLFDWIVAENGALLLNPATGEEKVISRRPPEAFVESLRSKGVSPLSVGRVIVSTRQPHEVAVLDSIRELGLELQVIFNKGAVMVLPSGVNKATGLAAALKRLQISHRAVVAIGDAENDHALLAGSGVGVAVANAVPTLKQTADCVTSGDHGDGVREIIDRLIDDDLRSLAPKTKHIVSSQHPAALPP